MKKKYITPAFTPLPLPHVRLLITSVNPVKSVKKTEA